MNPASRTRTRVGWALLAAVALLVAATAASAQTTIASVYKMPGAPGPAFPSAPIIQAVDGNFYGTTEGGGSANLGTVFKMTPGGVTTVLHSFAGGADGAKPKAALVQASDGNFYGTTSEGGVVGTSNGGTVFRITPSGTLTILYRFVVTTIQPTHGWTPHAALIQATDGNLYGTTVHGGVSNSGTVFRVTLGGQFSTVHSFGLQREGLQPKTALLQASNGNFYGTTTIYGGTGSTGWGTVFELTPSGAVSVLHVFVGGAGDGMSPEAPLIQGSDGHLYGTTRNGGIGGVGTVFRVTVGGAFTLLHGFAGFPTGALNGAHPRGSLVERPDGSFYGTTSSGGMYSSGTIFSITSTGEFALVHSFSYSNGSQPFAGLTRAIDGSFYGTTNGGGDFTGAGMVFRVTTLDVQLLDPISSYANEHAVTPAGLIDQSKLGILTQKRIGAATDGRTILLVRLRTGVATTFTIGGNGNDGTLLALAQSVDAANPSGSVTAQPVGDFVWAVYRAPARLGVTGSLASRNITITATPTGGAAATITVKLERPPVVLVHGAWDNPTVWTAGLFNMVSYLSPRGYRTYLANYETFNARSWDPDNVPHDQHELNAVRILQRTIQNALSDTRKGRIAATQADVVGHSTGGLVARALIRQKACAPWGRLNPHGTVQCYRDRTNLHKGWIRHLITLGTPHNGTPLAKFLYDNQDRFVFWPNGQAIGKLKDLTAMTGRPIDQGLVEDFIPGSPAYEHLGSTCDGGVRGYGIVGDHAPLTTTSVFDVFTWWLAGKSLDQFLGEPNDIMSGVRSQWGRGSAPSSIRTFASTVHSLSYQNPLVTTGTIAETHSPIIHGEVVRLLDQDPAAPEFQCFQSALEPAASISPAEEEADQQISPLQEPPDTGRGIHFVSPLPGTILQHRVGVSLSMRIEPIDGAVPRNLVFLLQNSVTLQGPSTAPFAAAIDLPLTLPLGSLTIVALAIDAVTGELLVDKTVVTIAPPDPPSALAAERSSVVFASPKVAPERLRVLATFDRGTGAVGEFDVSRLGAKYRSLLGNQVVSVAEDGLITPMARGQDRVEVQYGGLTTWVDVVVEGPQPFTDDVLTAGTAVVRAVHLSELRSRIDALREAVALPQFQYADAVSSGVVIRAQHISDLRRALSEVYDKLGLTIPVLTDPVVTAGTLIKRAHITELRAAVAAVE